MNDEDNDRWLPRRFKSGVCYVSNGVMQGEMIFLVLKLSETFWSRWADPFPVQYHALNLLTGEEFEFHRNSHIADNAEELIK